MPGHGPATGPAGDTRSPGRKRDPLYRIRRVLLRGAERLDERGNRRMLLALRVGDPKDEVLGAWLAKESVRDVYLAENVKDATTFLDKAIVGCAADDVPEIQALGRTLASWRTEILAHHETGASNGPTEALILWRGAGGVPDVVDGPVPVRGGHVPWRLVFDIHHVADPVR